MASQIPIGILPKDIEIQILASKVYANLRKTGNLHIDVFRTLSLYREEFRKQSPYAGDDIIDTITSQMNTYAQAFPEVLRTGIVINIAANSEAKNGI